MPLPALRRARASMPPPGRKSQVLRERQPRTLPAARAGAKICASKPIQGPHDTKGSTAAPKAAASSAAVSKPAGSKPAASKSAASKPAAVQASRQRPHGLADGRRCGVRRACPLARLGQGARDARSPVAERACRRIRRGPALRGKRGDGAPGRKLEARGLPLCAGALASPLRAAGIESAPPSPRSFAGVPLTPIVHALLGLYGKDALAWCVYAYLTRTGSAATEIGDAIVAHALAFDAILEAIEAALTELEAEPDTSTERNSDQDCKALGAASCDDGRAARRQQRRSTDQLAHLQPRADRRSHRGHAGGTAPRRRFARRQSPRCACRKRMDRGGRRVGPGSAADARAAGGDPRADCAEPRASQPDRRHHPGGADIGRQAGAGDRREPGQRDHLRPGQARPRRPAHHTHEPGSPHLRRRCFKAAAQTAACCARRTSSQPDTTIRIIMSTERKSIFGKIPPSEAGGAAGRKPGPLAAYAQRRASPGADDNGVWA